MIRVLTLFAAALCLAAQAAWADPPQTTAVRATGIGRPPKHMTGPQARLMARRAAEVVAVRNLAAKLQGQPIPTGRAGTAHTRLDAVVRGFRYLPSRELPDGTIEVTVELAQPGTSPPQKPAPCKPNLGAAPEQPAQLHKPPAEPPARSKHPPPQRHDQVQRQTTDPPVRMDQTQAQLDAHAAHLTAAIAALQQQLDALRQDVAELRAALADLRQPETPPLREP